MTRHRMEGEDFYWYIDNEGLGYAIEDGVSPEVVPVEIEDKWRQAAVLLSEIREFVDSLEPEF